MGKQHSKTTAIEGSKISYNTQKDTKFTCVFTPEVNTIFVVLAEMLDCYDMCHLSQTCKLLRDSVKFVYHLSGDQSITNRLYTFRYLTTLTIETHDKCRNADDCGKYCSACADLTSVSRLQNLRDLRITAYGIKSGVIALSKLTKLRKLYLKNMDLNDLAIASISCITNLEELALRNNGNIKSINHLKNLTNLKKLSIESTVVGYVDILDGFSKLESLSLWFSRIEAIEISKYLLNLKTLDISQNNIQSIEFLNFLPGLTDLNLSANRHLVDIKALAVLFNLETLNLGFTEVDDVTPLHNLPKLHLLNICRTKVKAEDLKTLRSIKQLHIS